MNAIVKSAREIFHLEAQVVDLDETDAVQNSPCPFGVFCMIYDGEIISHHPISNGRFMNIMQEIHTSN